MKNRHLRNLWKINEVQIDRIDFFLIEVDLIDVEMGIDPLAATYKWLERAFHRLKNKDAIGWYQLPNDSISAIAILNEAYCELLLWNPKYPFPEVKRKKTLAEKTKLIALIFFQTLELDEIRYNQVHVGTMRLLLIATIMTVLSHLTGSILKDYETIKTTLKSEMIILLEDFPQKKFVSSSFRSS